MTKAALAAVLFTCPAWADTAVRVSPQLSVQVEDMRGEYRAGPGMWPTLLLVGGANFLDYATTKHALSDGGREVGPVARHMSPEARLGLAVGLEVGVVQLLRSKGRPKAAWGVLAGFAAGHLLIAGCNRTGKCW